MRLAGLLAELLVKQGRSEEAEAAAPVRLEPGRINRSRVKLTYQASHGADVPGCVQQPIASRPMELSGRTGPVIPDNPGRGVTRRWRSVGLLAVRVQADLGQLARPPSDAIKRR